MAVLGKDEEVVKLLELRFKLCVLGVEADGTDVEKGGGVWFGLDGSVDAKKDKEIKNYWINTDAEKSTMYE